MKDERDGCAEEVEDDTTGGVIGECDERRMTKTVSATASTEQTNPVFAARSQAGMTRTAGRIAAGSGKLGVGTVTSPPQCGHGAATPTSAAVAEMCCPQWVQANVKFMFQ